MSVISHHIMSPIITNRPPALPWQERAVGVLVPLPSSTNLPRHGRDIVLQATGRAGPRKLQWPLGHDLSSALRRL